MILKCKFSGLLKKDLDFFDSYGNAIYSVEILRRFRSRPVMYLKDKFGNLLYWMMKKSQMFRSEYIVDDFINCSPKYAYCKGRKIYIFLEDESCALVLTRHFLKRNFEIYLDKELLLTAFSEGVFSSHYTFEFQNEKYTDLCMCAIAILFDVINNELMTSIVSSGFYKWGRNGFDGEHEFK